MILTKIIASYSYVQYDDDEDVVAFFRTFDSLAQGGFMNWFVEVGLPAYVGLSGPLLDWVAVGLYGESRPVLPAVDVEQVPAIPNAVVPDEAVPNDGEAGRFDGGRIGIDFIVGISAIGVGIPLIGDSFATSDDVFKRCLTWNLFKGDGKTFSIRWLKRRIKRFLDGVDGTDPATTAETYDVSVRFGAGNLVNIILVGTPPTPGASAVPNALVPDDVVPNDEVLVYSTDRGRLLRAAIETGALQLPFQYRYAVYG